MKHKLLWSFVFIFIALGASPSLSQAGNTLTIINKACYQISEIVVNACKSASSTECSDYTYSGIVYFNGEAKVDVGKDCVNHFHYVAGNMVSSVKRGQCRYPTNYTGLSNPTGCSTVCGNSTWTINPSSVSFSAD